MAADRAKTTLMIALIIFVMIAFILAVTTYLGFQQKAKELQTAQTARSEMEKANRERDAALDEARRVREVLGTDKDTADAVEAERNELFDRRFAGFDKDPKSLLRLVEWLGDAIRAKEDDIKRLEAEKAQIRKEQETAVSQAQSLQQAAEKARDEAVAEQAKQKADFDARLAQHQQAQSEMKAKQDQALGESERMRAITEELAKLGPLLSPDLRRNFEKEPAEWPERVRFVFRELLERQKTIQQLNATLARLRVADPGLQQLVRDATPADDQIDGFDGRVSSVNSLDRTVLLVCDSTAGMRPGLMLSVYDPDDPRPRTGDRKGLVEVVEVEGPTLARARIRQDSSTSPILAGDGVATSLWAPGTSQEIVVVGYVNLGGDRSQKAPNQDAATLTKLIDRNGGRVVTAVTPLTAFVVDAGPPQAADLQSGTDAKWRPADDAVRRRALERAKESGIRVISLDALLDMLGLDRESLDGRRLPNEVGAAP